MYSLWVKYVKGAQSDFHASYFSGLSANRVHSYITFYVADF